MTAMRPYMIVACSAVVAITVNVLLDLNTDLHMLVRWVIAVGIAMVVTLALSKWTGIRSQRELGRTR